MTETFGELLERLRNTLRPSGNGHMVRLSLHNHGFVHEGTVKQAIKALGSKGAYSGELNGLEKLGLLLLLESAGRK